MKRSNLEELRNLQAMRDQMTAIGCWRVLGTEITETDARRLFDRFDHTAETREIVERFCRIVGDPWTEQITREIDGLINRLTAFVLLVRSHALADPSTTLHEIYGGKAKEDTNALF